MAEEKSYVFPHKDEHVEVKLTGRTAKKTIQAVGSAAERNDVFVEITPLNMEDGRWKKFIRMTELMIVEGGDE